MAQLDVWDELADLNKDLAAEQRTREAAAAKAEADAPPRPSLSDRIIDSIDRQGFGADLRDIDPKASRERVKARAKWEKDQAVKAEEAAQEAAESDGEQ